MKTREEVLRVLREVLPSLRERYAVESLSLFGSVARGEQEPGSDVDLLVEFERVPNFWSFLDLEEELSTRLGAKVDLVHRGGLRPFIRERVVREEVPV